MNTVPLYIFEAVVSRTWNKSFRRPVTLMFSLVQPLIWLFFFGYLMKNVVTGLPAGIDYISFLLPGICGMTVLLGASQSGVSLIRDIQSGFLQRILLTPAPYWILLSGKVTADGMRLVCQAVVILLAGVIIGASLSISLLPVLTGFLSLFLFAAGFCSLSCIVALKAKRPDVMATFIHFVNMPVFFTSTALVPGKQMPEWLATVAEWNPLSLCVDNLRNAILFQKVPEFTAQLLPLIMFASLLLIIAVIELRRGTSIPAWEVK